MRVRKTLQIGVLVFHKKKKGLKFTLVNTTTARVGCGVVVVLPPY